MGSVHVSWKWREAAHRGVVLNIQGRAKDGEEAAYFLRLLAKKFDQGLTEEEDRALCAINCPFAVEVTIEPNPLEIKRGMESGFAGCGEMTEKEYQKFARKKRAELAAFRRDRPKPAE